MIENSLLKRKEVERIDNQNCTKQEEKDLLMCLGIILKGVAYQGICNATFNYKDYDIARGLGLEDFTLKLSSSEVKILSPTKDGPQKWHAVFESGDKKLIVDAVVESY